MQRGRDRGRRAAGCRCRSRSVGNDEGIGLGFPLVRYVAIIALATGVVRDLATGPYKGKETGETALLRKLLKNLSRRRNLAG